MRLRYAPSHGAGGMSMGQKSGERPKFDADAKTESIAPADEHGSFNTIVGEAIRHARQERGWTQAYLAEMARLSPNYIARLERGELGPSLFVANRIVEALGIDLASLVGPTPSTAAMSRKTAKRRAAF